VTGALVLRNRPFMSPGSVNDDPLQPHSHDPNPDPPDDNPDFVLLLPDLTAVTVTVDQLRAMPQTSVGHCFIVSTGHGTTGPFEFSGVALLDLIAEHAGRGMKWSTAEVTSADGFGTRLWREELTGGTPDHPVVLSHTVNGQPMTRRQGLVRLIVPSETDDALRQVKWVGRIALLA
jgi:hypothetical protein